MKKILWVAMAALLAAGVLQGGTITVLQPAGGSFAVGSACPVHWTASGVPGTVKIQLIKPGGALVGLLASNLSAGASPYAWTVAAPAVAGESYRIRVRASDGTAQGESEIFAVIQGGEPPPSGSISGVQISGNAPYCLGAAHTIGWTVSNVGQPLKLELLQGGVPLGVIAASLVPGTASYAWAAGDYVGGPAAAGSGYKVRVSAVGGSAASASPVFELKTCVGLGFKPGIKSKMTAAFKDIKVIQALVPTATLHGIYQNFPGHDTFPDTVSPIPISVITDALKSFNAANCGNANQRAQAGVYWFPYQNLQVAALYRSRIRFPLNPYIGQGAQLNSAKLKMKRVHSIHQDAGSGCGCNENLWVLKAPMTAFAFPGIGERIDVDMNAAEFSKDVTAIVKQWLDGALANNGLLLLAGELPCSGGRLCFSCYEASLLLYMK